MLSEALDFKAESDGLYALMKDLDDAAFAAPTQFKGWTLTNVLEHLHMWNWAAHESHADEANFASWLESELPKVMKVGMRAYEAEWNGGVSGRALLEKWHDFYTAMAEDMVTLDPKKRLKWAGPDMSARSSISARLMETWAHGQEIYDHLGVLRENKDHIKSIVVLGINTFGWTYATRGETPPGERPYVRLSAPSGEIWEFGEASDGESDVERIEGKAEQFCQVVTQVRNIADTDLQVSGAVATDWMSKAQCFAGAPETPPAPGTRFTR